MTVENLPDDLEALKKMLQDQQSRLQNAEREIARLNDLLKLFEHKKFSSKAETFPNQTLLFNEAEASASDKAQLESAVKGHKRKAPKRKPLPQTFPRIRKEYDLSEKDKSCCCGSILKKIGEEVSKQLDIIPAKDQVIQHVKFKYACPCCKENIKCANGPKLPLPKSIASPGLLAYILTNKYADGRVLQKAATKMGVGPPDSPCRRRVQTTVSCVVKEAMW